MMQFEIKKKKYILMYFYALKNLNNKHHITEVRLCGSLNFHKQVIGILAMSES